MRSKKGLGILCGALIAAAMAVPVTRGDTLIEGRQYEQLTFSQPVEIPGHVLAAGTYWFMLADDRFDLNTIYIFNNDRTDLLATITTVPAERWKMTDTTALTFTEEPNKQQAVMMTWFYPGRRDGHEFRYPVSERRILSEQPTVTVLAHRGEHKTAKVGDTKVAYTANW